MNKVILKVEIEEEMYKQIKDDSVYSNNKDCIISKSSSAYNALNAIINATPLTECGDCVSRQAVNDLYDKYRPCLATRAYEFFGEELKALPPVLPKREQGEWIMKHRKHNGVKQYTGTDKNGETHTIAVVEKYECSEPYCSKCGKRADDIAQSFCGYCGAEMR